MSAPTTPSKADGSIEELKQTLAAEWGLQFPARDPLASPSKRDTSAIDERVHRYIRYLYFNKSLLEGATALGYAIAQFEQAASTIISEWQTKPRAEAGVAPTRPQAESAVRRDFLRRRSYHGDGPSKELMLCLEHNLHNVVQRIISSPPARLSPSMRAAYPIENSRIGKHIMVTVIGN